MNAKQGINAEYMGSLTQFPISEKKKMAAIASLIAPCNPVHRHTSAAVTATKPIAIPSNLSLQILRPARQLASAPLFLTLRKSGTRLFAVAEETAVGAEETAVPAKKRTRTEEENRKLFVGNLRYCIRDEELKKIFEEVGAVEKAEVIYKKQYKKSRGFGFVTMKSRNLARSAVKRLHGREVGGREIVVNKTRRPLSLEAERNEPLIFIDSPHKVEVTNLGPLVTAKALKKFFEKKGVNVLSADVNINPKTNKCTGLGVVTFSSEEDAITAARKLDKKRFREQRIRVNQITVGISTALLLSQ